MDSLASMLSILRSGSQLTRADVGWTKSTIASEESAMADLGSKILALEAQRDALAKSLPIRRALVAPIRRLPPEILADIFMHSLPEPSDVIDSFRNMDRLRADNHENAPFLLLRVCHRWRDIAEKTARLWTRVSICCDKSIPYASLRFQNSRSAPLDVFIFSNENCGCSCPRGTWRSEPALRGLQDNEQSKKIIRKYRDFYRAFVTKLPLVNRLQYHGSFEVLSRLLDADMNSLKEVALESSLYAPEIPEEHIPMNTTHLHTLALYKAAHLVAYITPTNNLRRLALTCTKKELFIDPICDFLRSCPGIEELIFRCAQRTTIRRTDQSQSPIHLRALSNLQLQINDMADPEWIGLLHAPNLRAAAISYKHMDLRPLQHCLSIARKSLKILTFQELDFSYLSLRELLGTLHEIETLVLSRCGSYGTLWEYLTPDEGTPSECWICPKLQHLDIRRSYDELEDPRFFEFIRRRSDGGAEGLPSQQNGRWNIVDINFQDCVISQDTAAALSDLQVERKGLTFTGLSESLKHYVMTKYY